MSTLKTHQESHLLQLFILEMNNFRCPLWNLQEEFQNPLPSPTLSSTVTFPRGAALLVACVSSQVAWEQARVLAGTYTHVYVFAHAQPRSGSALPWRWLPAGRLTDGLSSQPLPRACLLGVWASSPLPWPDLLSTSRKKSKSAGRTSQALSPCMKSAVCPARLSLSPPHTLGRFLITTSRKATLPYVACRGPWRSWQLQQWACSSLEPPAGTHGTVPPHRGHPPRKYSICQPRSGPG